MRERPILFSTPMIKEILENRKTQTRRTVKHKYSVLLNDPYYATGKVLTDLPKQPGAFMEYRYEGQPDEYASFLVPCPFGKIGDRLWVRETYLECSIGTVYRADNILEIDAKFLGGWKPSIFMPRELSRITLEITKIRVERLQDISEEDAVAEGMISISKSDGDKKIHQSDLYSFNQSDDITAWSKSPALAYKALWESINGKGSWDLNPWVWVIEFRRVS